MKRNRKLDRAEVGSKMTAGFRNFFDDFITKFSAKLFELFFIKFFYVARRINMSTCRLHYVSRRNIAALQILSKFTQAVHSLFAALKQFSQ